MRKAFDVFYVTTKKGYDETYWIFVIIFGASVVTKLFGVTGLGASIIAFVCFYLLGRMSIRREKRLAEERPLDKKKPNK